MVPTNAVVSPAARRMESIRYVVVVFPFVPVTPMTFRRRSGWL